MQRDRVFQAIRLSAATDIENEVPLPGHVKHQPGSIVAPRPRRFYDGLVIHAMVVLGHETVDADIVRSNLTALGTDREINRKVLANDYLGWLGAVGQHVALGLDLASTVERGAILRECRCGQCDGERECREFSPHAANTT